MSDTPGGQNGAGRGKRKVVERREMSSETSDHQGSATNSAGRVTTILTDLEEGLVSRLGHLATDLWLGKHPAIDEQPKQLPVICINSNYFWDLVKQDELTRASWEQQLTHFLMSNGVAPALAVFRTRCYDNEKFMADLKREMPNWPNLVPTAKAMGERLSNLATAIMKDRRISEVNTSIINLAHWTMVIFQKNRDTFFARFPMPQEDALQLCGRLLLMVCEDLAFDTEDSSFFNVLLSSTLGKPMPSLVRAAWEALYRPQFLTSCDTSPIDFSRSETDATYESNRQTITDANLDGMTDTVDIEVFSFSEEEKLAYIQGFKAEAGQYKKNGKFSFYNISCLLPTRSEQDCLEYFLANRSLFRLDSREDSETKTASPPNKRRKGANGKSSGSSAGTTAGRRRSTRLTESRRRKSSSIASNMSNESGRGLFPSSPESIDQDQIMADKVAQLSGEVKFWKDEVVRLRSKITDDMDKDEEISELKGLIATEEPLKQLDAVTSERDKLEDTLDGLTWDMKNEEGRREVKLFNARLDATRAASGNEPRSSKLHKLYGQAGEELQAFYEAQLLQQKTEYEEKLRRAKKDAAGEVAMASWRSQSERVSGDRRD